MWEKDEPNRRSTVFFWPSRSLGKERWSSTPEEFSAFIHGKGRSGSTTTSIGTSRYSSECSAAAWLATDPSDTWRRICLPDTAKLMTTGQSDVERRTKMTTLPKV